MQIVKATTFPAKPKSAPRVVDSVWVTFGVPAFYTGGSEPEPAGRVFCARAFATAVLAPLEAWATKYGFGLCHLGCYVPRQARKADGTPIKPVRWSNHAHGTGLDWSGILTDGRHLGIPEMKAGCPAKLKELLEVIEHSIRSKGRRPEIVDEGGWIHLGIWS